MTLMVLPVCDVITTTCHVHGVITLKGFVIFDMFDAYRFSIWLLLRVMSCISTRTVSTTACCCSADLSTSAPPRITTRPPPTPSSSCYERCPSTARRDSISTTNWVVNLSMMHCHLPYSEQLTMVMFCGENDNTSRFSQVAT